MHDQLPLRDVDRRAFPRSTVEWLKLTFRGYDYVAFNWSAGGALIEDWHMQLPVGSQIEGLAMFGASPCRFRVCAEIMRRDDEKKTLALHFLDPTPALRHVLLCPTDL